MSNYKEQLDNINVNYGLLANALGDPAKDFSSLHADVLQDGALDQKSKELMALCVGISIRCEGCILDHLHHALDAGASKEEIVETVNVALMMSGGPAFVYGGKAIAALNEFLDKK